MFLCSADEREVQRELGQDHTASQRENEILVIAVWLQSLCYWPLWSDCYGILPVLRSVAGNWQPKPGQNSGLSKSDSKNNIIRKQQHGFLKGSKGNPWRASLRPDLGPFHLQLCRSQLHKIWTLFFQWPQSIAFNSLCKWIYRYVNANSQQKHKPDKSEMNAALINSLWFQWEIL